MVDDPSACVVMRRADQRLSRRAEAPLKVRLTPWDEPRELARTANGTSATSHVPQAEASLKSARLASVQLGECDGLAEEPIVTIEKIGGRVRTVSICVPGTNTCLADGAWTHNTGPSILSSTSGSSSSSSSSGSSSGSRSSGSSFSSSSSSSNSFIFTAGSSSNILSATSGPGHAGSGTPTFGNTGKG